MSVRFQIALLVFMIIQAVALGFGSVVVLTTALQDRAAELVPSLIFWSVALALPISWLVAPLLRSLLPAYETPRYTLPTYRIAA